MLKNEVWEARLSDWTVAVAKFATAGGPFGQQEALSEMAKDRLPFMYFKDAAHTFSHQ